MKYFKPGDAPPHANLVILEVLHKGETQHGTRYWIKFQCCGAEREFTHQTVRARMRRGEMLEAKGTDHPCKACSNMRNARLMSERGKDGRFLPGDGMRKNEVVASAHWAPPPMAVDLARDEWEGK